MRAVDRLWAGDATLWKSDEAHRKTIGGSLGWLTIAERIAAQVPGLLELAEKMRAGADRVLVLGMCGSSVSPPVSTSQNFRRFHSARAKWRSRVVPASSLTIAL